MLIGAPWDLDIADLPDRRVERAGLLIWGFGPGLLVLDAVGGDWVRPTGVTLDSQRRLLALSPDGDRLLLAGPSNGSREGSLGVLALATGEERWFDAPLDGQARAAAIAPDGDRLAVLVTAEHRATSIAALGEIDIATGKVRGLWAAAGGFSNESTVGWSPDGEHVAATYLRPDEEIETVIVGTDGQLRGGMERAWLLPSANAAWTPDGRAVVREEGEARLIAVQPGTGKREELTRTRGARYLAVLGRHLVRQERTPGPWRCVTTTHAGDDPEPLFTLKPRAAVDLFDIATGALPSTNGKTGHNTMAG